MDFTPATDKVLDLTTLITTESLGSSHPFSIAFQPPSTLWIITSAGHVIEAGIDGKVKRTIGIASTHSSSSDLDAQSSTTFSQIIVPFQEAIFHFDKLSGICIDFDSNVVISDSHHHVVRTLMLASSEVVLTAGTGISGCEDGPANEAKFNFPTGMALTTLGHIMVCDSHSNRIRLIAEGMVYTVAGAGQVGCMDGPSLESSFHAPCGIQLTADGEILIADTLNNTIRYVSEDSVSTVAGNVEEAQSVDGDLSIARLRSPTFLSWTNDGNLLFVETESNAIRSMNTDNTISTIIPFPKTKYPDLSLYTLTSPHAVVCGSDGKLFISDQVGIKVASWKSTEVINRELQAEEAARKISKPTATIKAPAHLIAAKRSGGSGFRPFSPKSPSPIPPATSQPIYAAPSATEFAAPVPSTPLTEIATASPVTTTSDKEVPHSATHQHTDSTPPPPPPDFTDEPSPPTPLLEHPNVSETDKFTFDDEEQNQPQTSQTTLVSRASKFIVLEAQTDIFDLPPPPPSSSAPNDFTLPSDTNTQDSIDIPPPMPEETASSSFLASSPVSPEGANIMDCCDNIVKIAKDQLQQLLGVHITWQTQISEKTKMQLYIPIRQIIRNFWIVSKTYKEVLETAAPSTYLELLMNCMTGIVKNIQRFGPCVGIDAATLSLNSSIKTSASPFHELVQAASYLKGGIQQLEALLIQPHMLITKEQADLLLSLHATKSLAQKTKPVNTTPQKIIAAPEWSEEQIKKCGFVGRWAPIQHPCGLYASTNGTVWATTTDHVVARFEKGSITIIAGLTGEQGLVNGPAELAKFRFIRQCGLVEDSSNTLLIVDSGNHCIRSLSANRETVNTFAGEAVLGFRDGSKATARFNNPSSIVQSTHGELIVSDTGNNRIRLIYGNYVSTIAGKGSRGRIDGPAILSTFRSPSGICLSTEGDLYIADYHNHLIRKISGGVVSTIAGDGEEGYQDGEATKARFSNPTALCLTPDGDLIVADYYNHCIRLIHDETVTTIAGTPKVQGTKSGKSLDSTFTLPNDILFISLDSMEYEAEVESNTSTTTSKNAPSTPTAKLHRMNSVPTSPTTNVDIAGSNASTLVISPSGSTQTPPQNVTTSGRVKIQHSLTTLPENTTAHRTLAAENCSSSGIHSSNPSSKLPIAAKANITTRGQFTSRSTIHEADSPVRPVEQSSQSSNVLLIADAGSIRIMNEFHLPGRENTTDFGLTLVESAMERRSRNQPQPWVLEAIKALRASSTVIKDLFSINSELSHVKPVVQRILSGEAIKWKNVPSRVTATILKTFFQKLPSPLLTMELQDLWIGITQTIPIGAALNTTSNKTSAFTISKVPISTSSMGASSSPALGQSIATVKDTTQLLNSPTNTVSYIPSGSNQSSAPIDRSLSSPATTTSPAPSSHASTPSPLAPLPLKLAQTSESLVSATTAGKNVQQSLRFKLDILKQLVRSLPVTNRLLLKQLIELFREFDDFAAIPAIWGPILCLRRSLGVFRDSLKASSRVIFILIEHSKYLFEDMRLLRGLPPPWLVKINCSDHIQDFFAPYIHTLIPTHMKLIRVCEKPGFHVEEIVQLVDLMKDLLVSLQFMFTSASSSHVVERYHLDRFNIYLSSFQDAWMKVQENFSSAIINFMSRRRTGAPVSSPSSVDLSSKVDDNPNTGNGNPNTSELEDPQLEDEIPSALRSMSSQRYGDAAMAFMEAMKDETFKRQAPSASNLPPALQPEIQNPSPPQSPIGPRATPWIQSTTPSQLSSQNSDSHAKDTTGTANSSEDSLDIPVSVMPAPSASVVSEASFSASPTLSSATTQTIESFFSGIPPAKLPTLTASVSSSMLSSTAPFMQAILSKNSKPISFEEMEEIKDEEMLMRALLRTTRTRNTFDRLVLSALYELFLFAFHVDNIYRGSFFVGSEMQEILGRSNVLSEDPVAYKWWRIEFSNAPVISWSVFQRGFKKLLPSLTPNDLLLLKQTLDNHGAGLVSLKHFSQFLLSYGPLNTSMMERLQKVNSAPWFRGYVSAAESEHLLFGVPEGSYIVRYSTSHAGSFTISSKQAIPQENKEASSKAPAFSIVHTVVERPKSNADPSIRLFSARDDSFVETTTGHNANATVALRTSKPTAPSKRFDCLADLVKDFESKQKLKKDSHPENPFEKSFCFGELTESEAKAALEAESPGSFILRVNPSVPHLSSSYYSKDSNSASLSRSTSRELERQYSGTSSSLNESSSSADRHTSLSRSNSENEKTNNVPAGALKSMDIPYFDPPLSSAIASQMGSKMSPGRFHLSFVHKDGKVKHEEIPRDENGSWMFGGTSHASIDILLKAYNQIFAKAYSSLPVISPILQDDCDNREALLNSLLQDEEGEDTGSGEVISKPPTAEDALLPTMVKISHNRDDLTSQEIDTLLEYIASSNTEATERLLRPRARRGTSFFGSSSRKEPVKTDVVKLESLNMPLNRMVNMTFSITTGDKPMRWYLKEHSDITSRYFYSCAPSEGVLNRNESVVVRISISLFRPVSIQKLIRVMTFSQEGTFQCCLPVSVRASYDPSLFVSSCNYVDNNIPINMPSGTVIQSDAQEDYWRIPPHMLQDTTTLASGISSVIFKAKLCGTTVVQKKFILRTMKGSLDGVDLSSFDSELYALKAFRHDNIATLIGGWCDPDANSVYLVLKYAGHGSMARFVHGPTSEHPSSTALLSEATALPPTSAATLSNVALNSPNQASSSANPLGAAPVLPATNSSPGRKNDSGNATPTLIKKTSGTINAGLLTASGHPTFTQTYAFRLSMVLDAARALHFLHRNNMIHRDVKTQNLLIDHNYRVQLADFGDSREADSLMTIGRGTPKYRAPELYSRVYNSKVDIFSFGLCIAEFFGAPIETLPIIAFMESESPITPLLPVELPEKFVQLIQSCCLKNPSKRPTAKQVVQVLNELRKDALEAEGRTKVSPRSRYKAPQ